MSFQLKEKRKIQNLRKTLQIISQSTPTICIHFATTHIRFFTQVDDSTSYLLDLQASFFSKFMAPEQVGPKDRLQISVERSTLLQSLFSMDDTELDISLCLQTASAGLLKVIKTRDMYLVQCSIPFKVDAQTTNDEEYDFPEDQLLLKGSPEHFKTLKSLFKRPTDQLTLKIAGNLLSLKNKETGCEYEIQSGLLERFGVYLGSNEQEMAATYEVCIMWAVMQAVLKIAEADSSKVCAAMETLNQDTALVFLTTGMRDWQCTVACGGVPWRSLDKREDHMNTSVALQRLKKANPDQAMAQMQQHMQMAPSVKQEFGAVEQSQTMVKRSPQQLMGVEGGVASQSAVAAPMRENSGVQQQQPDGGQAQLSQQQDGGEDEGERERMRKKQNFYNEVDNEEFF